MNAADFFAIIEQRLVGENFNWWTDDSFSIIRVQYQGQDALPELTAGRSYSPITAVCRLVTGKEFPIRDWVGAAKELELNLTFAVNLGRAQNNNLAKLKGREKKHRRKLLKITRMASRVLF